MFGTKWDAAKLKPRLKMANHRLQIATNKKSALMKQQKREIAKLLAEEPLPKEEKARIRAEALIRDDNTIEAYEILQLECELIHERIKLLNSTKHCPADMASCIATLIYASDRVDIIELTEIRKQFRAKYGKDFEQAALANTNGILNERVVAKLSVHPPTAILVNAYLEKIAEEFEVDWKAKPLRWEDQMQPTAAPQGHSVGIAAGSGLGRAVTGMSQVSIMEPSTASTGTGSQHNRSSNSSSNSSNNSNNNNTNNNNDSYNRGGSGGGGIPMGRVPSAIPATARVDSQDKPDYNSGIPIVKATSYHPPHASAPFQSDRNLGGSGQGGGAADVEIYVPVPMSFPTPPQNNNNNNYNDDDAADGSSTIASVENDHQNQQQDNNNTNNDGGNNTTKSDYDSLAARFANLKR